MWTGSSRKSASRLGENAALLVIALALSYLESLFPLPLPIPGIKLGLANLAVLVAARRSGFWDGAAVSISRVILSALLFGSLSSMLFSLSGAVLSLITLALLSPLWGRCLSGAGVSVGCAAAHSTGQILCAVIWMHESALLAYLPLLLMASAVSGTVVGVLVNILLSRLPVRR